MRGAPASLCGRRQSKTQRKCAQMAAKNANGTGDSAPEGLASVSRRSFHQCVPVSGPFAFFASICVESCLRRRGNHRPRLASPHRIASHAAYEFLIQRIVRPSGFDRMARETTSITPQRVRSAKGLRGNNRINCCCVVLPCVMAGAGRPPTTLLCGTKERREWPACAGHDTEFRRVAIDALICRQVLIVSAEIMVTIETGRSVLAELHLGATEASAPDTTRNAIANPIARSVN